MLHRFLPRMDPAKAANAATAVSEGPDGVAKADGAAAKAADHSDADAKTWAPSTRCW